MGGFVFSVFEGSRVTGFNLYSLLVAFVGACILIVLLRAISGSRARL